MKVVQNKALRFTLFTLGIISLIVGIVALLVPIVPTTPFLILAAWCFMRSSERLYSWLYRQPYFGKSLRDWDEKGAISPLSKALAIFLMSCSMVIAWFNLEDLRMKTALAVILLAASTFVLTRPSH